MYRKTNCSRHFALCQFFVDQRSREPRKHATSILLRCCHAHQTKFGHLRIHFTWKIAILIPVLCMGSDLVSCETAYHVTYICLLFVEIKFHFMLSSLKRSSVNSIILYRVYTTLIETFCETINKMRLVIGASACDFSS